MTRNETIMKQALTDISRPLAYLQRQAEKEGSRLNAGAATFGDYAPNLRSIADRALEQITEPEWPDEVFDILEAVGRICPDTRAGFSRNTGGVDTSFIVETILAADVTQCGGMEERARETLSELLNVFDFKSVAPIARTAPVEHFSPMVRAAYEVLIAAQQSRASLREESKTAGRSEEQPAGSEIASSDNPSCNEARD